ncbi:hypothetical protein, partial [Nostoc sp. CALU 1950]|uniref:hypothetical protein n=1 Tax=Nostoc sp. CALU 1950 TaxID=3104321 RepID=UPI003EC07A41
SFLCRDGDLSRLRDYGIYCVFAPFFKSENQDLRQAIADHNNTTTRGESLDKLPVPCQFLNQSLATKRDYHHVIYKYSDVIITT